MDSIILTAISFALVLAAVWFVLIPLFEKNSALTSSDETASASLKERYFLQLEELESDYRSEKIDASEYQERREECMSRLAEILEEEQHHGSHLAAAHSRSE